MRKLAMYELGRLSVTEAQQGNRLPLWLALDRIRSGQNVGSILRTADAYGVGHVLLGGYTPAPPNPEVRKTALGADQTVPWQACPDLVIALTEAKAKGARLVALELTDQSQAPEAIALDTISETAPLILILGHEVDGVSDEVLAICDAAIALPQFGTKHSLNVAVAAGIATYLLAQRLRAKLGA
jgi:tRNA G18 (ribose-2'-O)-methylase SpoU